MPDQPASIVAAAPLVTIGLPMKNVAGTISGTLRSIFAQTYSRWELLIVDDGSTDESVDVVRRIRDPRVKILVDGCPRGLVYRLNQIASMAQTPYVARMDADDLMHPERIARQIEFLDTHPSVAVVGASAWVIDAGDKVIGVRDMPAGNPSPQEVLRHGRFVHPTVMARREWFLANPYDADYLRAEDHELWCRTMERGGFASLEDRLLFYRDYTGVMYGKYAQSCRTQRRIFRRYGPPIAGQVGTAALIAASWAKQLVYIAAAGAGASGLLARSRNRSVSAQSITECEKILSALNKVVLPGLD